MVKLLILLLAGVLLFNSVKAELFKWKDEQGNTIYSDQPPSGDGRQPAIIKKEQLPPIVTVPAIDVNKSDNAAGLKSDAEASYQSIAISDPGHDAEVRENAGNVSISVQVEPYVFNERGDTVVIYMDGKEISRGSQTSVQLQNVDRGTHTLRAEVLNRAGQVLTASETTVFHLKRFSAITPSAK